MSLVFQTKMISHRYCRTSRSLTDWDTALVTTAEPTGEWVVGVLGWVGLTEAERKKKNEKGKRRGA